jgi:selenium metabolism protein YedF
MITIDTCGNLCPQPLIMTKKALDQMQTGEQFEVLTDNDTSHQNLMSYLEALQANPTSEKHDNIWTIRASKPANISPTVAIEEYCDTPANRQGNYVVVIKNQVMGFGDDDLGKLLMRGFINSLKEQERLPSHIILYNAGVLLTVDVTDTAQSLNELTIKGVSVIVCGTCVDFYQIKEKLGVGTISNMFQITNILTSTEKIIYP